MPTIFAILCIVALLAVIGVLFRLLVLVAFPPSTEDSPVSSSPSDGMKQFILSRDLLERADAMEATEVATRASDYARIRAAGDRFGGRVPRHTLNAAIYAARLAHDIASEPRAALLAGVGTLDAAEEATRLLHNASDARVDLPGALARFAALQSSPILDEIVTEIVERR